MEPCGATSSGSHSRCGVRVLLRGFARLVLLTVPVPAPDVCRTAPRSHPREVLHAGRQMLMLIRPSAKRRPAAPSEMGMVTLSVLTVSDLLSTVWDEHADPFTRTVQVTSPPPTQARPTRNRAAAGRRLLACSRETTRASSRTSARSPGQVNARVDLAVTALGSGIKTAAGLGSSNGFAARAARVPPDQNGLVHGVRSSAVLVARPGLFVNGNADGPAPSRAGRLCRSGVNQ